MSSLQSWDDVSSHDVIWDSWSALTLQSQWPEFISECTPGQTNGINPVLSKDQLHEFFDKVESRLLQYQHKDMIP